jgi:pimeloyl-ACP methyl ester carboxylesterase
LPEGTTVETWQTTRGPRRVLYTDLATAPDWAVLVPGFTGSKEDFIGLLQPLRASGFAVLTFDQLGQYESPGTDAEGDYALQALASDLKEILDLAQLRRPRREPPHLLGHSFGGLVSQAALQDPALQVASWTGLCTGPGALPERRRGPLPALIEALPQTPLADLWEVKRTLERSAGEPDPPADVEEFCRNRWLANHPVGLRSKAVILCRQPSLLGGLTSRDRLPKAVVYGEHDDAWPITVQRTMADEIGADCLVIPQGGHSPNADVPEATSALLATWWRQARG